MMGKKLEKIKKTGINLFFGRTEDCVPKRSLYFQEKFFIKMSQRASKTSKYNSFLWWVFMIKNKKK